jgi:hypothetical protein
MKILRKAKYLLILFVLFSLNAKSSKLGSVLVGTYFIGIPVTVAYAYYWHDKFDSENGMYISPGLDPKMLSEIKLDVRHKVYYKHNRYNPYIVLETFGWAEYESITGGLDYCFIDRKLSFLAGFETGIIHNQDKLAWTYGVNAEMRLHVNDKYSLSYIANVKSRPLISKDYVYSGYIHLNIKL